MNSNNIMPVRDELPKDLSAWRGAIMIDDNEEYNAVWQPLDLLLEKHGLKRWRLGFGSQGRERDTLPLPDNYVFLGPYKQRSVARINQYLAWNGLSHAASGPGGRDFILRVMTAGGQGNNHLRIIRRLSHPPDVLRSQNHVLPMVDEIVFKDIIIGVFPRSMFDFTEVMGRDVLNSVEDALYMVLQALEGIAYLHGKLIGHRDLFLSNFMVEWCPESMSHGRAVTRPRVYIVDFETAVEFSEDSLEQDRRCFDFPHPRDIYNRPMPAELKSGEPYSPFPLDIWQFGYHLQKDYPTGLPEVDQFWAELVAPEAQDRPSALQAFQKLDGYMRSVPPSILHIPYPVPQAVIDANLDN